MVLYTGQRCATGFQSCFLSRAIEIQGVDIPSGMSNLEDIRKSLEALLDTLDIVVIQRGVVFSYSNEDFVIRKLQVDTYGVQ